MSVPPNGVPRDHRRPLRKPMPTGGVRMGEPDELNTVTIAHADGPVHFRLVSGGYNIGPCGLTIAIECKRMEGGKWPESALLRIGDHPLSHPLMVGDQFTAVGGVEGDDDAMPNAHAYFDYHVHNVTITWRVLAVGGTEVEFSVEAVHDGMENHDEHGNRRPTTGRVILERMSASNLWDPTY